MSVVVGVHRHNGICLGSELSGKVFIVRTVGVICQLPAKLGSVSNLDLCKGTAFTVDLFLPEQNKNGFIKIVFDVSGIKAAVEISIRIEGNCLVLGQQAGISGALNDVQDV